jgi:predicted HTH domain antitoxin
MQTSVKIPDFVFQASHLTPDEVFLELAISLFEKKKLTLGQASNLCNLSQYQFQHILASRSINVHYDIEDFNKDVDTLKSMGLI